MRRLPSQILGFARQPTRKRILGGLPVEREPSWGPGQTCLMGQPKLRLPDPPSILASLLLRFPLTSPFPLIRMRMSGVRLPICVPECRIPLHC